MTKSSTRIASCGLSSPLMRRRSRSSSASSPRGPRRAPRARPQTSATITARAATRSASTYSAGAASCAQRTMRSRPKWTNLTMKILGRLGPAARSVARFAGARHWVPNRDTGDGKLPSKYQCVPNAVVWGGYWREVLLEYGCRLKKDLPKTGRVAKGSWADRTRPDPGRPAETTQIRILKPPAPPAVSSRPATRRDTQS
eukprot:7377566-Prymnesium_polylepis.1